MISSKNKAYLAFMYIRQMELSIHRSFYDNWEDFLLYYEKFPVWVIKKIFMEETLSNNLQFEVDTSFYTRVKIIFYKLFFNKYYFSEKDLNSFMYCINEFENFLQQGK